MVLLRHRRGPFKPDEPARPEVSFADVTDTTPHADDVRWLAASGVSEGWLEDDGSRTFRGMDTVKRQDMAAFLYRLAGSLAFEAPAESPFSDVGASTPHYVEVCWLAESGVSRGWDVGGARPEFRGMSSVVRQDMAAFLRRMSDDGLVHP